MTKSIIYLLSFFIFQSALSQRIIHSNIGIFGKSTKHNDYYTLSFSSVLSKSLIESSDDKSLLVRPFIFGGTSSPIKKEQVKIFPNPSSDIFYLETDLENISYELQDIAGHKVKSANSYQVSVHDITSGIYTIQIYSNSNFIISQKAIIQK